MEREGTNTFLSCKKRCARGRVSWCDVNTVEWEWVRVSEWHKIRRVLREMSVTNGRANIFQAPFQRRPRARSTHKHTNTGGGRQSRHMCGLRHTCGHAAGRPTPPTPGGWCCCCCCYCCCCCCCWCFLEIVLVLVLVLVWVGSWFGCDRSECNTYADQIRSDQIRSDRVAGHHGFDWFLTNFHSTVRRNVSLSFFAFIFFDLSNFLCLYSATVHMDMGTDFGNMRIGKSIGIRFRNSNMQKKERKRSFFARVASHSIY